MVKFVFIGIEVIVVCGVVVLCRVKRLIVVVKFWRSGVWFNTGRDEPSSYVKGGIVGECPVLWFVREVVVVVGVVVSVASVVAPFICTHGTS